MTAKTTATTTVTAGLSDSGSSKVAIGVGVGVPLGILAIAMLGAGFLWGRRNTQAKYRTLAETDRNESPLDDFYAQAHPFSGVRLADSKPIHEVPAALGPSELSGTGHAQTER